LQLLKEARKTGFYAVAMFTGIMGGVFFAATIFRDVYAQSIGYPIALIGLIMGISRFIWFALGNYAHILEKKISVKKLLLFETFLFPTLLILISFLSNPFVVGGIFSLFLGYKWGRYQIITNFMIKNYIKDKRYKATMLSISAQITSIFAFSLTFLIGFVMDFSYKIGYFSLAIFMFLGMIIIYPIVFKN